MREEAQLWDILSRDLTREAGRLDEAVTKRSVPAPVAPEPLKASYTSDKLLVPIPEAARIMGIGRSTLYNEINASRLKVRKAGKRTLVASSDIHEWCRNLPGGEVS